MATFAGEVEVTVTPDTSGFGKQLEADALAAATRAAEKIGKAMGRVIADKIATGVAQGLDRVNAGTVGRTKGTEFGRTFASSANAAIKATLKDVQQVRVRMLLDESKARQQVAAFAEEGAQTVKNRFRDGLEKGAEEGSKRIPDKAPKTGEEYGGKFAQSLKARLETALKSLPDVKLDADSTPVDRAIAGIREELSTLQGKRIGIDITSAEALAKVGEIKARLDRLGAESPDVSVRVDAAAASASLAAVQAQASKLDRARVNIPVDADTGGAQAGLAAVGALAGGSVFRVLALSSAVVAVGSALIPVAAAGATAFAGIALGATAAAGAAGVLILALYPIVAAVQAVTQAQYKQASSTGQAASRAIQLANAQDALADAERGVRDAEVQATKSREDAARRITDAKEALRKASEDAAQASEDSARRVQDAERARADAYADASLAAAAAARRVQDAERALADAQDAERDAQLSLTAARKDAADQLRDLQRRTEDMALSRESAQIAVERAQQRLTEVNADASASDLDRREAALRLAEAQQRLKEINEDAVKLAQKKADADAKGIEGSDAVTDAQKRLADAQQKTADAQQALVDAQQAQMRQALDSAREVQDAERALADARRDQARQQAESVEKIADAQRAVADAQSASAEQQRKSAEAILAAQQRVIHAQRGIEQATVSAGSAGGAAMQQMREKLAALTPEGRAFVAFLTGPLKGALSGLSGAAQRGFLPGLQSGLEALLPALPAMTAGVEGLARVLGDLAAQAGAALAGPWWQDFFAFLGSIAGPVLRMMGETLGNFMQGLAGMFQAMTPLAMQFGEGLLGMSRAFADFGRNADSSDGFQRFIAYALDAGPKVVDFFKQFIAAIVNIGVALAPLGDLVLKSLTSFLAFIAGVDPGILGIIAVAIGVVTTAIWAMNIAMAANPIGLVIIAIGALVAALVIAYQHSETFRAAVAVVWEALKAAAAMIWEKVQPALTQLVGTVRRDVLPALEAFAAAIAPIIAWMVEHLAPAVARVWSGIVTAIDGALKIISGIINVITALITGDWDRFWRGIGQIVTGQMQIVKGVIQVALGWAQGYFTMVGGAITAIWTSAWQMIADAAKAPVKFMIDVVINRGIIDTWNTIAGWFGVKPVDHVKLPWSSGGKSGEGTTNPGGGPNKAFAGGGYTGAGGKYDPAGIVHAGEFVFSQEAVRRIGLPVLDLLHRSGQVVSGDPGSGAVVNGYAAGGPVAPAATVPVIQAWLRTLTSKPYVWGGVGPDGWDCSGITGSVYAMLNGLPPYRRYMTTASDFGALGFAPGGSGMYAIGVNDHHMVGRLGGLAFEAPHTGANIRVGPSAQPTSNFPRQYHLASLGGGPGGGGEAPVGISLTDPLGSVRAILSKVLAGMSEITGSPFGQLVAAVPRKIADAVMEKLSAAWKAVLHPKIPGFDRGGLVRPLSFDDGGYLPRGLSLVDNGTAAPEPVLSAADWEAFRKSIDLPRSISADVTVNNPVPETASESTTRVMRNLARFGPNG